MQAKDEAIYSPCSGTVEKVLKQENDYVYEWEKLFLIKANNGRFEEISVGISGSITSLKVKQGQKVESTTTLATIKDDFIISGCE